MGKIEQPHTPKNVCARCGEQLVPHQNRPYCAACTLKATQLDHQSQIGPYLVDSPLGEGGMGKVFLAFHETTARAVALKIPVTTNSQPHSSLLKRFAQESHVLSLLDHPGILPIYEVGEDQGQPWFAMKLAEGGTLADRLDNHQPLPPREAAQLLAIIASAVQFAHNHGILHRDLKPHNILLDENGQPMVGDFGLARVVDHTADFSRSLAALGTPGYSAPEVSLGHAPSAAADLFSLGAIFYHLLSGNAPFRSDSLTTTLELARQGKAHPLTRHNVPLDLWQICRKCLEPAPEDRYASATDLEQDLQAWLDGRSVSVRPLSPLNKLSRIIRRHPLTTAMILTTSLAVIASLTITLIAIKRVQHADARHAVAAQQINAEHRHLEQLDHIRLLINMPRAGHRREAFELLREEWTFRPSETLRSLAIRTLTCSDFQLDGVDREPDLVNYTRSTPASHHHSHANGRSASVNPLHLRELHIKNHTGSTETILTFEDDIVALQWNETGDKLAIGCLARNTYLWQTGSSSAQLHIRNRESATTSFSWHPSETLIACRTEDGSLYLWDLQRRQDIIMQRYGIPANQTPLWNAAGTHLSWSANDKQQRTQVTLPVGLRVLRHDGIGGKRETFSTLSLNSKHHQALWVTDEGTWLWNWQTNQHRLLIPKTHNEWMGALFTSAGIQTCGWSSGLNTLSGKDQLSLSPTPPQTGSRSFIGAVLLTSSPPPNEWLALLDRPRSRFLLTQPNANRIEKTLFHESPFAIALSRNASLAATSSFQNTTVHLWDLQHAKPVHDLTLTHTSSNLSFSPDASRLATVGSHTLTVWNTHNATSQYILQASEPFQLAAWSPNGKILAVQTHYSTRLHRAKDGMILAELVSPISQPGNRHIALAFDHIQPLLGEQLEDGTVILWDLNQIQHELEQLGMDWPID